MRRARFPSRKFCCCIPVRLGVIIISLLGLAGGGLIAVAGVLQAKDNDGNKIPLIIQIVVYGLLALLSVFGLIGAIFKRRRLITLYVAMLAVHLIFSIASGVYSIYQLFVDSKTTVDDCVNGSTDKDTIEGCQKGVTLIKAIMIVLFIIVWLIELWGSLIVRDYANQLADEQIEITKEAEFVSRRY